MADFLIKYKLMIDIIYLFVHLFIPKKLNLVNSQDS